MPPAYKRNRLMNRAYDLNLLIECMNWAYELGVWLADTIYVTRLGNSDIQSVL